MIPICPCIHRVLDIGEKNTGFRSGRARVGPGPGFFSGPAPGPKKCVPAAPWCELIECQAWNHTHTKLTYLRIADICIRDMTFWIYDQMYNEVAKYMGNKLYSNENTLLWWCENTQVVLKIIHTFHVMNKCKFNHVNDFVSYQNRFFHRQNCFSL